MLILEKSLTLMACDNTRLVSLFYLISVLFSIDNTFSILNFSLMLLLLEYIDIPENLNLNLGKIQRMLI